MRNVSLKSGIDKLRYDRIASFYDLYESPMEFFAFAKWRKLLFKRIKLRHQKGLILEIGVGTGKNIPFYGVESYIAFDISGKMISKAKARKRARGKAVELLIADAEFMPFKDESFDVIVSTFTFCSIENPVNGLREAFRVLKLKGCAFFLEHMLPESKIIQPVFHLLNPVARLMGLEINRKTNENIEKGGFKILREEKLFTSVFRLIEAVKE